MRSVTGREMSLGSVAWQVEKCAWDRKGYMSTLNALPSPPENESPGLSTIFKKTRHWINFPLIEDLCPVTMKFTLSILVGLCGLSAAAPIAGNPAVRFGSLSWPCIDPIEPTNARRKTKRRRWEAGESSAFHSSTHDWRWPQHITPARFELIRNTSPDIMPIVSDIIARSDDEKMGIVKWVNLLLFTRQQMTEDDLSKWLLSS